MKSTTLRLLPGPQSLYRYGADQATSHHLNQWWLVYWRMYASFGLSEIEHIHTTHSAPAPYSTMHHLEQKCAHMGQVRRWICEIGIYVKHYCQMKCSMSFNKIWILNNMVYHNSHCCFAIFAEKVIISTSSFLLFTFHEDTFTIFEIQTWLPDFILGISPFRIFCACPIWAEVTYYFINIFRCHQLKGT